jgi:hypothetical protein
MLLYTAARREPFLGITEFKTDKILSLRGFVLGSFGSALAFAAVSVA